MEKSRRNFIKKAGLVGIAGLSAQASGTTIIKSISMIKRGERPKVLFFDVNETLLDLGPLKESVAEALGGKEDLVTLWFTTMLQYSLVVTTGNRYEDFGDIGAATLRMVAKNNGIDLNEKNAKEAISPIKSLPPHPEVKQALKDLRNENFKLVSLTNSSNEAVSQQFSNAGLTNLFDEMLSIEDIGKYKPHQDTYNWASRKMGIKPEESMLIAAHGWDIAGALWANWRAAFISRLGKQLFPLAPPPEIIEPDLEKVVQKILTT